jgi:spore coat polysaccharide biosynthesis protein SpsF (cytidylyltransferase family)
MNIVAIVQARIGSKRFPNKVLTEINGTPMIVLQLRRVAKSKLISEIVVAIPESRKNDKLETILLKFGFKVVRGPEEDVLARFLKVISETSPDICIRLTADCPLIMPEIIDEMTTEFLTLNWDYLSNTIVPTFPDGLDVEVFKPQALICLSSHPLQEYEREHVTIGFHNRKDFFQISNFHAEVDYSRYRWTVDYEEDLPFVKHAYEFFLGRESEFCYNELLDWVLESPINESLMSGFRRNESLEKQKRRDIDEI